ncbi:hypothetical protein [Bartonella sp. CB189]
MIYTTYRDAKIKFSPEDIVETPAMELYRKSREFIQNIGYTE